MTVSYQTQTGTRDVHLHVHVAGGDADPASGVTQIPTGYARPGVTLLLGLGLRREPRTLMLVPGLPVQHVARLLLPRRRLLAVPDLVTPATSVEVHVSSELEAVGAPAEVAF